METTKGWWRLGPLLVLSACAVPPRPGIDPDTARFDLRLAQLYLNGDGVPRDDAKAFYLASDASAGGDANGQELLGRLYAEGRGVRRDDEMATSLFRAAVDGGSVPALTDLGQMIETGRGTKADPKSALDYYERGMEADDPKARQNYQRLKKLLDTPPPKAAPVPDTPKITQEVLEPPG